ncbi:MAG: hypothetical protein V8S95_10425 [Odoribacter sp.]
MIDAGRSKKLAFDYALCGLLLNKQHTQILPAFRWLLSLSKGRTIAVAAYEEALLVAQALGWKIVCEKEYVFSRKSAKNIRNIMLFSKLAGRIRSRTKK